MKKYYIIITIINLDTNTIERIQFKDNPITRLDKDNIWRQHMKGFRGVSTSINGYEAENCPEYKTMTGILKDTNILITWTEWENNLNS